MVKKSERLTPEVLDISGYDHLDSVLDRDQSPTPDNLIKTAEILLEQTSKPAYINNLPGIATVQSFPVKQKDRMLFARVAQRTNKDGSPQEQPSIIFCTDESFPDLSTPSDYFSALKFNYGNLVVGDGTDPLVNDPRYLELTQTILKGLASAFKESHQKEAVILREKQEAAARAKEKKRLEDIHSKQTRKEARKNLIARLAWTAGAVATVGGLLYGPETIALLNGTADKYDARFSAAVPAPWPVEWFVDMANQPDHTAQSYPRPSGALTVTADVRDKTIPFLNDYPFDNDHSAEDVVNSIDIDTSGPNAYAGGYRGYEDSKPGLYESSFDFTSRWNSNSATQDNTGVLFTNNTCYEIRGDFSGEKTSVFTQTPDINKMIDLQFVNSTTLNVCKAPNAASDAKGSIFLYQNFTK